jgi:hypothetical protein
MFVMVIHVAITGLVQQLEVWLSHVPWDIRVHNTNNQSIIRLWRAALFRSGCEFESHRWWGCTRYNIMSLVFSGYSGFNHDITEINCVQSPVWDVRKRIVTIPWIESIHCHIKIAFPILTYISAHVCDGNPCSNFFCSATGSMTFTCALGYSGPQCDGTLCYAQKLKILLIRPWAQAILIWQCMLSIHGIVTIRLRTSQTGDCTQFTCILVLRLPTLPFNISA